MWIRIGCNPNLVGKINQIILSFSGIFKRFSVSFRRIFGDFLSPDPDPHPPFGSGSRRSPLIRIRIPITDVESPRIIDAVLQHLTKLTWCVCVCTGQQGRAVRGPVWCEWGHLLLQGPHLPLLQRFRPGKKVFNLFVKILGCCSGSI